MPYLTADLTAVRYNMKEKGMGEILDALVTRAQVVSLLLELIPKNLQVNSF